MSDKTDKPVITELRARTRIHNMFHCAKPEERGVCLVAFVPIEIGGTMVHAAGITWSDVLAKDLRIGDVIIVRVELTPDSALGTVEVLRALSELRDGSEIKPLAPDQLGDVRA